MLSVDGTSSDAIVQQLQQTGNSVTLAHDPGEALQRLADYQLVIVDATDEAALATLCRRINDEASGRHPPMLAVAHDGDVESRVRLLEAGADDVLAPPIDERELAALVEALILRAAPPADHAAGQAGGQTVASGPGRVIAFAAAKGGSGTTTLAVNTAVALAQMAPGRVAIVDLDMLHGQVSTHLDVYARSSTAQLAREDYAGQSPDVIREAGRRHSSGLMVFGGPYRPDEGNEIGGAELVSLLEALRLAYPTLVVDAGSAIESRSLAVLDRADRIVTTVTPDIPSLRLLHAALQVMSDMGPLADRTTFVLNDTHARRPITAEQIEEHLGVKIGAEVPYDGEGFLRTVNEGQPLILMAPQSAAATAIKRLAEMTTEARAEGGAAQPLEAQPQRKGLLRGFLGRN